MANKTIELSSVSPVSNPDSGTCLMAFSPGGALTPVTLDKLAELVRDTVRVGGRNLLKNSDKKIKTSSYNVARYDLTETPTDGEDFIFTLWGHPANDEIRLFNSGGTVQFGLLNKIEDGVYRKYFKWKSSHGSVTVNSSYVSLYVQQDGNSTEISRVKLERGNIPTDWSPAPEDLTEIGGGKIHIPNVLHLAATCGFKERRCAA